MILLPFTYVDESALFEGQVREQNVTRLTVDPEHSPVAVFRVTIHVQSCAITESTGKCDLRQALELKLRNSIEATGDLMLAAWKKHGRSSRS
jgi:hypothetical protein